MPSEGWFRKRSMFSQSEQGQAANVVPDGVAVKCLRCGQILFTRDLEKNLKVCPVCGFHHKLTADERIRFTVDEGSFVKFAGDVTSVDTLQFPEYKTKLEKSCATTGLTDGMTVGVASIERVPLIVGVADFRFIGGTMGSVGGEVIVRALELGIDQRLPVVLFTASGGARMQEGLISLMQMAKTSAAVAAFARHGLPYIVVFTDPTTAGVLASYASLGDISLAEPGALIGFAGARVAAAASTQKAPDDYQTAEWQLGRGQVDQVVQRRELPHTIATLLQMFGFAPIAPVEADVALALNDGLDDDDFVEMTVEEAGIGN